MVCYLTTKYSGIRYNNTLITCGTNVFMKFITSYLTHTFAYDTLVDKILINV